MAAAQIACLMLSANLAALAKDVSEALSDMSATGSNDPHGFTLMVVCIGILFTLAVGTMIATFAYAFKGKKSKTE